MPRGRPVQRANGSRSCLGYSRGCGSVCSALLQSRSSFAPNSQRAALPGVNRAGAKERKQTRIRKLDSAQAPGAWTAVVTQGPGEVEGRSERTDVPAHTRTAVGGGVAAQGAVAIRNCEVRPRRGLQMALPLQRVVVRIGGANRGAPWWALGGVLRRPTRRWSV